MLGMDLYNQLADCGYWMLPVPAYVARYMLLVSSQLLIRHFQQMPAQIIRGSKVILPPVNHGNCLPAFTVTSDLSQNGESPLTFPPIHRAHNRSL